MDSQVQKRWLEGIMRSVILFILIMLACSAIIYSISPIRLLQREPIEQHIKTPQEAIKNTIDAVRLYITGDDDGTGTLMQQTPAAKQEQVKLFGYELAIEYLPETSPAVCCTHNRPTLYFHGWGNTKNSTKVIKKYFDVLPGDVITFNFPDAHGLIAKFRDTSFGQLPDVLVGLYVLKQVKTALNLKEIDLFGISRGGGVTVNLIAVLNDKTGTYDKDLMRIGIDAQERKELLQIIQNGCIVLNCPLINMNTTLKYRFPRGHQVIAKLSALCTKYQPGGLQALDSAHTLLGLNLNVLIHYQHNDQIVSNHCEAEFYQALARHNPDTTYLVLGNDGGHIHTHTALCKTIHTFRKQFGSSYEPGHDARYSHEAQPEAPGPYRNRLLQPGDRAEQCIGAFHHFCRYNRSA